MRTTAAILAAVGAFGCPEGRVEDEREARPPAAGDMGTGSLSTSDTIVLDTTTLPTSSVTADPSCAVAPPAGPRPFTSTIAIPTTGDFDFDTGGFLTAQRQSGVAGYSRSGDWHWVSRDVGYIYGIRSLPLGDMAVAEPATGRVSLLTGSDPLQPFVGGLAYPYAIEAASNGTVLVADYVRDGAIWTFDPYTGDGTVLADVSFPSGLALAVDEATLWVATTSGWFHGTGRVSEMTLDEEGTWSAPREVYASAGRVDALAVDVCDNLYVVEAVSGRVVRIRALDGGVEQIADLGPSYGLYTAARFGAGLGGFDRDVLYVTNGPELWAIEVGVEGRHVLAASGTDTE